ncbi:PD-(D/E)XK nuclease-like domain-containing protein [Brucella intermedia]|uniref:PD-(D/E)XK nuclease-like domain-containing protein n=1 Tax=Brucella intermedia TaxID=94625 RepID=UPI000469EFA1|nr:PD-(D/E)XK nuclease-like domain-containing protein [Brucella intermedia]
MNKIDIDRDSFQQVGSVTNAIVGGLAKERRWDGKPITESGVYSMVPIETYHRDTSLFGGEWSISSTGLKSILRRPLEYWYASPFNPNAMELEGSKALDFGKAAHMLILGEEGFAERYVLRPEQYEDDKGNWKAWSGNAKVCREWMAKQAELGKAVITQTEIDHITRMADALSKNEIIRLGLLNGRIERSIFAKQGNIWLRNRPDNLPNDSGDVVDLKTAASVDDENLARTIFHCGYHVAAGLTRMVMREVLGPDAFTSFTFVFVEKTPPYDVRVVTLKEADIDLGEQQVRMGLKVLERCIKENTWPGFDGFDQHISWIEMPAWSRSRVEDQIKHMEQAA